MSTGRFDGKQVLVTGGSSGIGVEIAVRLASEGAQVTVTGRREDRLQETAAQCAEVGLEARVGVGDVRDRDAAAQWVALAAGDGRLDGLVNNAGVIGNDGILSDDEESWRRIIDINVEGLYRVTRAAVPKMVAPQGQAPSRDHASASIVNVSSVCGIRPYGTLLSYCTSKAAVDMMTRCLALELAPRGVRVNAVNPGVVRSELHKDVVPDYAAFLERANATHPAGFHGEPSDVAALTAFLLSDESPWITGGIHSIDGGRALTSLR
ncbi:MAG: SDR family NAD(P)-dependent oxidoreductase [Planctomycetota bacterium]|jgi:NAD(P)-dependent dehydrogenase (short-subunit alcohol dehydrogenase family)